MISLDPFPHVVLDDWFDRRLLVEVAAEMPPADDPAWRRYRNEREHKNEGGGQMWGPATVEYFTELTLRTEQLEELFGIDGLHIELVGGGYHLIPPGGRLEMHTDFNRSPRTGEFRRLNVLTYLNEAWDDPGGHLYLGKNRQVQIVPEMGRTVAFATSDDSWHGHPIPAQRERRSVAAYFFTADSPAGYTNDHSTTWLEPG